MSLSDPVSEKKQKDEHATSCLRFSGFVHLCMRADKPDIHSRCKPAGRCRCHGGTQPGFIHRQGAARGRMLLVSPQKSGGDNIAPAQKHRRQTDLHESVLGASLEFATMPAPISYWHQRSSPQGRDVLSPPVGSHHKVR